MTSTARSVSLFDPMAAAPKSGRLGHYVRWIAIALLGLALTSPAITYPSEPQPKKGFILVSKPYGELRQDKGIMSILEGIDAAKDPRDGWRLGWFYTFKIDPGEALFRWSSQGKIEFIPMFYGKNVIYGPGRTCKFLSRIPSERCIKEDLIQAIDDLRTRYKQSGGIIPSVLLGFNEPFGDVQSRISPAEAAQIYGEYLIPIARANHMRLATPSTTMKYGEKSFNWITQFYQACLNDSRCDVGAIDIIPVHHFACEERSLADLTSPDAGFFRQLATATTAQTGLQGPGESKGGTWLDYFKGRSIWVTATSCNASSTRPQTPQQSCMLALGEGAAAATVGRGSLNMLKESKMVERFAWWGGLGSTDENRIKQKACVNTAKKFNIILNQCREYQILGQFVDKNESRGGDLAKAQKFFDMGIKQLGWRHGATTFYQIDPDGGFAPSSLGNAYRYFDAAGRRPGTPLCTNGPK